MNNNGNNLDLLDMLTILSVALQIMGYRNDMSQSSNDDLMKELQRQDKAYLEKIIENQNKILENLADLGCYSMEYAYVVCPILILGGKNYGM